MSLEKYIRKFKSEELIFEEKSSGSEMFIVKKGSVRIEIEIDGDEEEETRVLGIIEEGEFFGEMAIIATSSRSARAVAASDCMLVALNKNRFYELIEHSPEFAIKIVKKLSERLKEANQRLKDHILLWKKALDMKMMLNYLSSIENEEISIKEICDFLNFENEEILDLIDKVSEFKIISIKKDVVKINDKEKIKIFNNFLKILQD